MFNLSHSVVVSESLKANFRRILCFFLILFAISCSNRAINENSEKVVKTQQSPKINGVSMVSVRRKIDSTAFIPVSNINATWVANIPFGFIPKHSATVNYNEKWQWYGEKTEGIIESINLAKGQGLKTLLKPHLWIHDIWVGDLDFDNEENWKEFENSYLKFILDYAKIAESMGVEAFCVGVELKQIVKKRPQFWNKVIDSVRNVYSGKLTYAANWDNYENVTFWNKLDFIGIDAYFPISVEKTPSIKSCYTGWESDFNKIKALSFKTNKKVIFTEFGYRNVDFTGKEPWDDKQNSTYNTEGQNNAYQALLNRFWGEPWFEGGFLWKWYPNHPASGGLTNNRFTPQNKPVEAIIRETFKANNE